MVAAELFRPIRMLAVDVDGILTDGYTWMDTDGEWKRRFFIRDGIGLRLLKEQGYMTAVITASRSADVRARMAMLNVDYFFEGSHEKLQPFQELLQRSGLQKHQIAFMGDDIYDIPIMREVGVSITVPDVPQEVTDVAKIITKAQGGHGAVREICDQINKFGFYASSQTAGGKR